MKKNSIIISLIVAFLVCSDVQLFGQLPWIRHASNPVMSGGGSGEWNSHMFWPNVLYNPDSARYEMWYSGSDGPANGWRPMYIGFATSPDGINWTPLDAAVLKPTVGAWDESSVEPPIVIRENGQYKMWYSGWSPSNPVAAIGYATSDDGKNWIKHPDPVMTRSGADWDAGGVGACSVVPYSGGYKMWYSGWTAGYTYGDIGYATSTDGITWVQYSNNPVITHSPGGGWDDGSVESPYVQIINNTYHLWYTGMRPGAQFPFQIGWATSADGITWHKYDDPSTTSALYALSDPVLQPASGQWDGSGVQTGTVLVEGDSLLRLWYCGAMSPTSSNPWKIGVATAPVILNVPGDYSSIQSAIDAAVDGNVVLVADGTYQENINFKGKAIMVTSHYYIDGDTSHISNTVIDGSNPSDPDSGSVVYFISGEDTNSVLCGFTITGGTGTLIGNGTRHGGGLYILNSTAYVRNNHIEFNSINNSLDAFGGGIYAGFFNNQDLIIENNLIRKNSISSTNVENYCLGGGIYTWADGTETVRISNNRVFNNAITAPLAYGGGIDPANAGNGNYVITNNHIKGNTIDAPMGASGAIDIYNHFPTIHNNLIINNSAPNGGGLGFEYASENLKSENPNLPEPRGSKSKMPTDKTENKFQYVEVAHFSNNTIVGNSAINEGGGISIIGDITDPLMNFIVWGNTAPTGPQISGVGNVQYSDIEGGYDGRGNFSIEPAFSDSLFHLKDSSACIGNGSDSVTVNNITYYAPSTDIDGDKRPYTLADEYVDIGADESHYTRKIINGITVGEITSPVAFKLSQNYPNPFNPTTNIEFSIPKAEFVTLKIYNILGQEVATLVSEKQNAGRYEYSWDATGHSSGIYYYKFESGKYSKTNKMILLR